MAGAYTLAEVQGQHFDAAFIACWWSHIPLARLDAWLATLHGALQPGAFVLHLDNSFVQTSSSPITRRDLEGNTYQTRSLSDGSTHEVLKNFPTADEAFRRLGARAINPQWQAFTHYWALSYTLA